MTSKVSLEEVEYILSQNKVEPEKQKKILDDLNQVIQELQAHKDDSSVPKQKWEHVIVLSDPEGKLEGVELGGWVVQQESGEDAGNILTKLQDAAKDCMAAMKRKKRALSSWRDIFMFLKPKFLKEKKLRIKTKELSRVLIVKE